MAFSLRKMLSNISYFTKPGDGDLSDVEVPSFVTLEQQHLNSINSSDPSNSINFDREEPDSTSKCATSLKLPESVKNFAAKKGSLSDTDLLAVNIDASSKKNRRKCRKLKLDIKKASQSMIDAMNHSEDSSANIENTPKHYLLECKSSELFSNKFQGFNFNCSYDIFDAISDTSSCNEEIDIESLSSDTDASASKEDEITEIKMCRKVESQTENKIAPSATPESFGDVEVDKNEEERMTLLLNYQMKLERVNYLLKKLLTEFKFHIEVSKVLICKSVVTALPGSDVNNMLKIHGEVTYLDNIKQRISPTESWNIVMEKEDYNSKFKLKKQLLVIKHSIEHFINTYLHTQQNIKNYSQKHTKSFNLHKNKQHKNKVNKKKLKHFDFPDFREAMVSLFSMDTDGEFHVLGHNITKPQREDEIEAKCTCHCHSPSDSGLTTKTDRDLSDQSITSSIGNFSLDSTTLSAYSESLDKIISYNSFQDTSLYCTLLQKAAMERITFYVQVHSIQLKCDVTEQESESKNTITFYCPACKITEIEENSLLKHILSYEHGEKIHFLYKTVYIKKCVSAGKEIQPSTVLNPMKMYRDDNKIVCFGDAVYACSLCFENLIIGESMLMAHCSEEEHASRKERLSNIID